MIDREYECDWYLEDKEPRLKTFDERELKRVARLHVVDLGPFFWIKGQVGLLNGNYDIYFTLGSTRNLSLFVFLLLKKLFYRKKRVYLWTHGYYGKESNLEMMLWKGPMLKLADGIFTYGDYAKKLLVQRGFDSHKIFPIHNSLDYDVQLKLRKQLVATDIYSTHFNNSFPVLIFIGRLTPVKHLDMLIDSVEILKSKGEFFNITFIGDGSEKESLLRKVDSYGLQGNVWFYGACYNEKENAELVFNADLCVAPGNIGLTAMHSLMFGCPAISHDNFSMQMPEFEAIIPNKTGNFYAYNSVEDLSTTIHEWFRNHKHDREIVRQACYEVIDTNWNPYYQMDIIKKNLL